MSHINIVMWYMWLFAWKRRTAKNSHVVFFCTVWSKKKKKKRKGVLFNLVRDEGDKDDDVCDYKDSRDELDTYKRDRDCCGNLKCELILFGKKCRVNWLFCTSVQTVFLSQVLLSLNFSMSLLSIVSVYVFFFFFFFFACLKKGTAENSHVVL